MFTALVSVLLLTCAAFGRQHCDLTAGVGDTVSVPPRGPKPSELADLVWQHATGTGFSTVFQRSGGRVWTGPEKDVTEDGSLVLRDVRVSHAGRYCARVAGVPREAVTLCVTKPVSGLPGAAVQLDPDVNETIGAITWLRGPDTVAKWDGDLGHEYRGRCRTGDQCELNPATGVLVMKGLKPEDEGQYFAEVNGKPPVTGLELTLPSSPAALPVAAALLVAALVAAPAVAAGICFGRRLFSAASVLHPRRNNLPGISSDAVTSGKTPGVETTAGL